MAKPSKSAKFYRMKAEEMRRLAKRAADASIADKLNDIAREYERLAVQAELPLSEDN